MNPSSLYIHIPFCKRKCLFCSFAIAVGQEHVYEDYLSALGAEMKKYRAARVSTVYLGGGTPSQLNEDQLRDLVSQIRDNFVIEDNAEMTIEVNPESIYASKAEFLLRAGFNRVSLGVQSTQERYLKFLGRAHDVQSAREAYVLLRKAGFQNINLDLMYAFPGQTRQELEDDVRNLACQGSEHLSLYTLTVEPHSRFYATGMKLDDEEKLAEHYLLIAQLLEEYGFKQYEVSNFARPGFESAHNINYWQCGSSIGLGMGAHGFLEGRRYWNTSNLQEYLQRARRGETQVEGYEDLNAEVRATEKLLFGLRMNKGVSWEMVSTSKHQEIRSLIKEGFLVLENGFVKTTRPGRLVLDTLSERLV